MEFLQKKQLQIIYVMSLFKSLEHILTFSSKRPKNELVKDLTEDGFTNFVKDNGEERYVVAVTFKIDKDIN